MSSPTDNLSEAQQKELEAQFHQHLTTLQTLSNQPLLLSTLQPNPYCLQAFITASLSLPPTIFNHVTRTFYYTLRRAALHSPTFLDPTQLPFLYTAALLHDIGASAHPTHNRSHQRFEIDGADVAAELLARHAVPAPHRHDVWVAIALHATPQIAERIAPLARLVREAVRWDFGVLEAEERERDGADEERSRRARLEEVWPRGEVERDLGDAVVRQAVERPGKAPMGCWSGELLEAWRREPGFEGVNPAF
ncbi:MAG: hypothetical protein M1822_006983 [Bathelium mastoideum]|nr:MAG: hypothetical protein M1822_006983 [Bathelium mastoideum]